MRLGIPCALLAVLVTAVNASPHPKGSETISQGAFGVKSILDSAQNMVASSAEELRSLSRNFRANEVVEGTKTLLRTFTGHSSGMFAPVMTKQREASQNTRASPRRHRELEAVLGTKRDHASRSFARRVLAPATSHTRTMSVGVVEGVQPAFAGDLTSVARELQTTSQPAVQTIQAPGDSQCGFVGRRVQVNTTTDVCAGVDVTPAQQAAITSAVAAANDASLDDASRAAANAAITGVPGVGSAVFTAAVDANTPLPAGFDISGPLTPAQVAAVVAAANVSSSANITTFAQLAPVVSSNGSANGTISADALLLALPLNASSALLGAVTCAQRVTTGTVCQCPLDYIGGGNCTARAWGCSLRWNEPQVTTCIASNAALPGLDFSSSPPVPLSRVSVLEYSTASFGLPPCAFFDQAQSDLTIRLASTCAYRSDDGVAIAPPTATCNGSSMDAAFFGGAAALAASPLDPAQAPYFGFNCVEAGFAYSTGGAAVVDWGARLPSNITAEQLPLQLPFSLTALQAADSQRLQVRGRLSAVDWQVLSDTSAGVNVALPLGEWSAALSMSGGAAPNGTHPSADSSAVLQYDGNGLLQVSMQHTLPASAFRGRFAVGGRAVVYGQLTQLPAAAGGVPSVAVASGNSSSRVQRAPFRAAAVGPFIFDERNYEEPQAEKPSILVAVLVPTLLAVLGIGGGLVLWRHKQNKAAADKQQLEQEGFGLFSGEHDDVAAARRRTARRATPDTPSAKPLLGGGAGVDSKGSPGALESKASPGQ
mgnify:CR=1 FL=1